MELCLINGSHRVHSQSCRIADHISKMQVVADNFKRFNRIDLSNAEIPVWNEGVWDGDDEWNGWFNLAEKMQEADAFLIITPEWGGMVPPRLKNLLLLASIKETGHKPALIVSVSAGQGGFAPMTELRSFAYKNNHICYIPDHVILRNVESLFKGTETTHEQHLTGRIEYSVRLLKQYASALKSVRTSGVINDQEYKYGMS